MGYFRNHIVRGELRTDGTRTLLVGSDAAGNNTVVELSINDAEGNKKPAQIDEARNVFSQTIKYSGEMAIKHNPEGIKDIKRDVEDRIASLNKNGEKFSFVVDGTGVFEEKMNAFVIRSNISPKKLDDDKVYFPVKLVEDKKRGDLYIPMQLSVYADALPSKRFVEMSGDVKWEEAKESKWRKLSVGDIEDGNFNPKSVALFGKVAKHLADVEQVNSVLEKDEAFFRYIEGKKTGEQESTTPSPRNSLYVDTNPVLGAVGGKANALKLFLEKAYEHAGDKYSIPFLREDGTTLNINAKNIDKFIKNDSITFPSFDAVMELNLKNSYANLYKFIGIEDPQLQAIAKKTDIYTKLVDRYNNSSTLNELKDTKEKLIKEIRKDGLSNSLLEVSVPLQSQAFGKKDDPEYIQKRNMVVEKFLQDATKSMMQPLYKTMAGFKELAAQNPTNMEIQTIAEKIDKKMVFEANSKKPAFTVNDYGMDMRNFVEFAPFITIRDQKNFTNRDGEIVEKIGYSAIVPDSQKPIFINGFGGRYSNSLAEIKVLDSIGLGYVKATPSKIVGVDKDSMQTLNIRGIFSSSKVAKKAEEPKVETPKAEEPKAEEPKVETPKVETPKAEEPKVETPKVETPKVETPKVETPKVETPKVETPKAEEPQEEATLTVLSPKTIETVDGLFESKFATIDLDSIDSFLNADNGTLDTKKANAVKQALEESSVTMVP